MPFKKGEPRLPNAGRKAGIPNKATLDIKALARAEAPSAFKEAARLALHAKSETARLQAISIILERGFGKPHATISGPDDGPIQFEATTPEQRAAEAVAVIDETFGLVMGVSKGTGTVR